MKSKILNYLLKFLLWLQVWRLTYISGISVDHRCSKIYKSGSVGPKVWKIIQTSYRFVNRRSEIQTNLDFLQICVFEEQFLEARLLRLYELLFKVHQLTDPIPTALSTTSYISSGEPPVSFFFEGETFASDLHYVINDFELI